jgi:Tol biopolymer transport system component
MSLRLPDFRRAGKTAVLGLFATLYVSVFLPLHAADVVSSSALTVRSAAGSSYFPVFSADGRTLVFLSHANNLVTNDDSNPFLDVFVHDLQQHTTKLISVGTFGFGGGNGESSLPSISSNGTFVAFESAASNLVPNDTNNFADIFLRDISAGITTLVSASHDGVGNANGQSAAPLLSADGRFVVFESRATNLVTNDLNGTNDLFIRDLQFGATRVVSASTNGTTANGYSRAAAMTPDARYVAFVSSGTDLINGPTNRLGDLYVRDVTQERTIWASADLAAYFASYGGYTCISPAISADGRVITFKALPVIPPYSQIRAFVFRYDIETGATRFLTTDSDPATPPQISADGRMVAFENGGEIDVFDASANTNVLVISSASSVCKAPIMAADGRRIAFLSNGMFGANGANGLFQVYFRDVVASNTTLVTVNTNQAPSSTDAEPSTPVMSPDGNLIAFDSTDASLVESDLNLASDVFLRDARVATTELISRAHPEKAASTAASLAFVRSDCLSSNGQLLLFSCIDNNIVMDDTNGAPDVFIRDLVSRTNIPVSILPRFATNETGLVITNALFRTNFVAWQPALSANGRFVAFTWDQAARDSVRPNGDVYIRDLQASFASRVSRGYPGAPAETRTTSSSPSISADGSIVAYQSLDRYLTDYITPDGRSMNVFVRRGGSNYLVSINRTHSVNGDSDSLAPIISPDSRWVLFYSAATDLTTDSLAGGYFRIFAHDLSQNQTRLLSGVSLSETCTGAIFSANSRYVAFYTTNSQTIFRYDFQTQASTLVCTNCSNPAISGDGQFIAFESRGSASGVYNIFIKDVQNNVTTLSSGNRFGNGGGNGHSRGPQISPDARYLVFGSKASDLVENDFNNASDIFVRDLVTGTTTLLSLNSQGTRSGNGLSSHPVLSPDGRTIAFQSFAGDLVAGDYNSTRDIFVVRLGRADTDHDGLDDDWEMVFFNTLSRDGSGDFDNDGQTDREEFLAGTDPTNSGSVLRAFILSRASGDGFTILWNAVAGRSYTVQFKDTVDASSWTNLAQSIRAAGSTASAADTSATASYKRFYRVLLQR